MTDGYNLSKVTELKSIKVMKKKIYSAPQTIICECLIERSLLVTNSHEPAWNPSDENPDSTIPIVDEKDGNLGEAGSEISGAKGHNVWSKWDD